MNHLDVEQVERLLDGEMPTTADHWVQVHMADCGECRERVALAERQAAEIRSLLSQVDHEPPKVDARGWPLARARGGGWQKWAAGILLVIGSTGILYAAPGRRFAAGSAAARWIGHEEVKAPRRNPHLRRRECRGHCGDSRESLVILFEESQPRGRARITWPRDPGRSGRRPVPPHSLSGLAAGDRQPRAASTYDIEIPLRRQGWRYSWRREDFSEEGQTSPLPIPVRYRSLPAALTGRKP
jgi:hypothetical protein